MSDVSRRDFLVTAGAASAALAGATTRSPFAEPEEEATNMYGMIRRVTAKPGQRDRLIEILLEGANDMPGCLSYVVAKDPTEADAIWITEVWEDPESHEASLSLPSVREAMAEGKPLIAEFGEATETQPVGGHGLAPSGTP